MRGGSSMRSDVRRKDAKTLRRNVADRLLSLASLRHCVIASLLLSAPLHAQITRDEYSARRDSLVARVGTGVLIAFGGRKPVSDFGPFYQIPAVHYLTVYEDADAALILV